MLDTLQITFWSITYVLIIIAGFQSQGSRKVSMPYPAVMVNYAWEFCALINSRGFWGHIVWFLLDSIIICFGISYIRSKRNRLIFAIMLSFCFAIFSYIFTLPNGMLHSCFAIDLLMEVCFLIDRQKLSPKLKVPIAITKLLGDTCAGLYYAPQSNVVGLIACIVFMCNVCYLYLCIEETRERSEEQKTEHNS